VGRKIGHQAIALGVLLRPLGNVLYLMPPYCITESELAWIYRQIDAILAEVLDRSSPGLGKSWLTLEIDKHKHR
jgi:adenosylmethionine-8-amino-7-oxononanoate aminotransferase